MRYRYFVLTSLLTLALVFAGPVSFQPAASAGRTTYLPNAMVKLGAPSYVASDYVGYDVYGASFKTAPSVTKTFRRGGTFRWAFMFQNDGSSVDNLYVQACSSSYFPYHYYIPDLLVVGQWDDVTSQLMSGLTFTGIAPGGGLPIKASVKIPKNGNTWPSPCRIRVESQGDNSVDWAKIKFKGHRHSRA